MDDDALKRKQVDLAYLEEQLKRANEALLNRK